MKVTLRDVRLGEIYYRYLLELARDKVGMTIRYGELVARAKQDFPDDPLVRGAIPISIGNRLLIIELFCTENSLPNLACLAVNASGRPGDKYRKNWEDEMARVAAFDWTDVEVAWGLHVDAWRIAAMPKPKLIRRSPEEAGRLFTSHWKNDAAQSSPRYDASMENRPKENILTLIGKGHQPSAAFAAVLFGSALD
jgi:hypothetical protein